MVELNPDGTASLSKKIDLTITSRQSAPRVYDMNASMYFFDRDYIFDERTVGPISDRSLIWVMDEISAFDIDNEVDIQFVEFVLKSGLAKL